MLWLAVAIVGIWATVEALFSDNDALRGFAFGCMLATIFIAVTG